MVEGAHDHHIHPVVVDEFGDDAVGRALDKVQALLLDAEALAQALHALGGAAAHLLLDFAGPGHRPHGIGEEAAAQVVGLQQV